MQVRANRLNSASVSVDNGGDETRRFDIRADKNTEQTGTSHSVVNGVCTPRRTGENPNYEDSAYFESPSGSEMNVRFPYGWDAQKRSSAYVEIERFIASAKAKAFVALVADGAETDNNNTNL